MAYPTSGLAGANFSTLTAGTTTDGVNALFKLGTMATGTDGSIWQYVQAGEAIGNGMCVAIDENFQAKKVTATLARAGHGIGFAQQAFADNDLGWVVVHGPGNINMHLASACAADVQLYTTATAGVVDDTATSTMALLRGCVAVVAASTTSLSIREGIAVYPSGVATP